MSDPDTLIPDFEREAHSLSYPECLVRVVKESSAAALARRMFALGMRYAAGGDNATSFVDWVEEEATLIENGGQP